MTSMIEFLNQNYRYYSDKCFNNNFHIFYLGKEIQREDFNEIKDHDFSHYEITIYNKYKTLKYDQMEFTFCEGECFSVVYKLIQRSFNNQCSVTILCNSKRVSPTQNIESCKKYTIKVEYEFPFKEIGGNFSYININYLATILDAKKTLSLFVNKDLINLNDIIIYDEDKKPITDNNRKLNSIQNHRKVIYFKINGKPILPRTQSDEYITALTKSCYSEINSITKYLTSESVFCSSVCLKQNFHISINGKIIQSNEFNNVKIIDKSDIKYYFFGSTVTMEYEDKKFVFAENEIVSVAEDLIKKVVNGCAVVLISNEIIKTKLPDAEKLNSKEKYSIKIGYRFKFTSLSGIDSYQNMNYLSNVSDAKKRLSMIYTKSDINCINIYDDDQCEITDLNRQLKSIHGFYSCIYFDIKINENPSKIISKEVEKKDDSIDYKRSKSNDSIKKDTKIVKSKKIKIKGPTYKNLDDDDVMHKDSSSDLIEQLNVSFVFSGKNEEKFSPFSLKLSPEIKINEITKIISEKYSIEDKINLCYKEEDEFIQIGLKMTLKDICEDMNEKDSNSFILYIQIIRSNLKSEEKSIYNDDYNDDNDDDEILLFSDKKKEIFLLSVPFLDKFTKEKIGRGATSEVFKINYPKYPNKFYALKVIDIELIKNDDNFVSIDFEKFKRFYIEFEVMNKIDHPNIVKAYGFCTGDETHPPCILLEYCPNNLKKVVKKLNLKEQIQIIIELSDAMKTIHEQGLIHRDLKPENILIDSNMHAKVSDFGICTFIKLDSETASRTQFAGTMRFMAPELLNENKFYDEKVDVYSFGVVVYYILTRGEYPNIKFVDVAKGKQAQIPKSINPLLANLISLCWSFEAKDRPPFKYLNEYLKSNKLNLGSSC